MQVDDTWFPDHALAFRTALSRVLFGLFPMIVLGSRYRLMKDSRFARLPSQAFEGRLWTTRLHSSGEILGSSMDSGGAGSDCMMEWARSHWTGSMTSCLSHRFDHSTPKHERSPGRGRSQQVWAVQPGCWAWPNQGAQPAKAYPAQRG